MANPTIGGITFLTMRGRVTPTGTMVVDTTPDDESGHEYQELGDRAPESLLVTELDVDTDADITAHIAACKALQGTLVTIEDPHGEAIGNVMILEAVVADTKRNRTAVGGINGGSRFVTMNWRVQATL